MPKPVQNLSREFRSNGGQTIIWGKHPEGGSYTFINEAKPLTVHFDSIIWPSGLSGSGINAPQIRIEKHCQDAEDAGDAKDAYEAIDVVSESGCSGFTVESIVSSYLPTRPHQTNDLLFKLARGVRTLEAQEKTLFDLNRLQSVFNLWFSKANPDYLCHDAENYWFEFMNAYKNAKVPLGVSLQQAFEKAKTEPHPPACNLAKDPMKKLMIATCYQLQQLAGDEPFFLPVLKCEPLFNVPHRTCSYWLNGFVIMGILKIVIPADKVARKATRFRYIHGNPIATSTSTTGSAQGEPPRKGGKC
jgi:hypothetical protein